jgi:4-amino-4-deoxy-L-arabinose transferase-like glycosyltransferase
MLESGRVLWRRDLVAALAVGAIALVPRLLIVSATPLATPIFDMAEYWNRAVFILEHGELYENSTRMPAYPLVLALVLRLFQVGPSLEAARLFNALAGAAAAMLTYWLARRTANTRAALFAALAVALYPSLVIYTTFTATEAVVTVPLLGALIAATYGSYRAAVIAGMCAALSALVRPAGIAILLPVLVGVTSTSRESGRWVPAGLRSALVVVAFAFVMLPWWLHNARLHGRFVPLDTSGGINMAIGNNPHASGTYRWREARHLYAMNLVPVEVATPASSDAAAAVAFRHIREHPGEFVRLVPRKLAALFALEGREHAYLYSLGFFGPRRAATLWMWSIALTSSFPLLLAAAVGGLAVRRGISPQVLVPALVFIAAIAMLHVMSFGDPRYHLPIVPVLAVLATGLARAVANGVSPSRLASGVVIVALLATAWSAQLSTYRAALGKLTAPTGWNSQLSYDDLL